MKRFLTVLMIMVMIPYVTTMAWTGRIGGGGRGRRKPGRLSGN